MATVHTIIAILRTLPFERMPRPVLALIFVFLMTFAGLLLGMVVAFFAVGFLGTDAMVVAIGLGFTCMAAMFLYGVVLGARMLKRAPHNDAE